MDYLGQSARPIRHQKPQRALLPTRVLTIISLEHDIADLSSVLDLPLFFLAGIWPFRSMTSSISIHLHRITPPQEMLPTSSATTLPFSTDEEGRRAYGPSWKGSSSPRSSGDGRSRIAQSSHMGFGFKDSIRLSDRLNTVRDKPGLGGDPLLRGLVYKWILDQRRCRASDGIFSFPGGQKYQLSWRGVSSSCRLLSYRRHRCRRAALRYPLWLVSYFR